MNENRGFVSEYEGSSLTLNAYLVKVFAIMFAGLAITAVTAAYFAYTGLVLRLGFGFYAVAIGELALVVALTRSINKIQYATAVLMFAVYSLLSGVTLSYIFLAYEIGSIGTAFVVTSVVFAVMAVYGRVTKNDLTGFGSLAMMVLVGALITILINFFLRSAMVDYVISLVLLVVFVGLVAFDTQKLKAYYYAGANDVQMQRKLGIIGALSLYLDFINIFIYLLRLFGRRN